MPQIDPTALRLAVTFGTMGAWVIIIAFASARRGEKLGGFLIGIPSAAGLAFFFIGLFTSSATAVSATDDFPLFLSVNGIFLLAFGYLSRRSFTAGIGGALSVWLVGSFLVVRSGLNDFGVSLAGGVAIFAVVYYLFRFELKPQMSTGGPNLKHSIPLVVSRFFVGGGIVSLAVYLGQIGAPTLSAMAASFPALSLSALLAVRMNYKSEGTSHARGLTMASTVSLAVMLIPFTMVVHYLYPAVGVVTGTVVAYSVATVIGIAYYFRYSGLLVPSFREDSLKRPQEPALA